MNRGFLSVWPQLDLKMIHFMFRLIESKSWLNLLFVFFFTHALITYLFKRVHFWLFVTSTTTNFNHYRAALPRTMVMVIFFRSYSELFFRLQFFFFRC